MKKLITILLSAVFLFSCGTANFSQTKPTYSAPTPNKLIKRLSNISPNGKPDNFAILLGASTELRHKANLSIAYQTLLEKGYKKENIFILDSDGLSPFFPSDGTTSKASVKLLFEKLAKIVEKEDGLFIYITGHGRRVSASGIGVSTISLNAGEELSYSQLINMLDGISPKYGFIFIDNCYTDLYITPNLDEFIFLSVSTPTTLSKNVSFPRTFFKIWRNENEPSSIQSIFKKTIIEDRATIQGFNKPKLTYRKTRPENIVLGQF